MPDQQQIQNKIPDELDEVLVKEPDGTFRIMKIASAQNPVAPVQPPKQSAPPRIVQSAPTMRSLADDEEKEVAGLADRAKALGTVRSDDVELRVRNAIKESGVILADQTFAGRLSAVLVAYCKEVRNELETRALLMKPKESGGLALTMNDAARLLSMLSVKEKFLTPVTPSLPAVQKPPMPLQVIAQEKTPTASPIVATAKPSSQPLASPLKSVVPSALRQTFVAQNSGRKTMQQVTPSVPQKPAVLRPITPSVQEKRQLPEAKPIVQDVSFTPTLVGPVDELRMSLIAWRRMAATIKDRATKIEEKLRLLEDESYPERLKGIAAWYGSEVMRQYEDAGRASLMTGKSVAEILTERQAVGTPALSLEEFQSIAELNERIRF